MAGEILTESYGVDDTKREKRRKRTVLITLLVVIVALTAYFSLRTKGQERVMSQFLRTLQDKRYEDAFKMFPPSPRYSYQNFLEDFGPTSKLPDAAQLKVSNVDYCDDYVAFTMNYPHQDPFGLMVDRSTGNVGFMPEDQIRCPGRHLQFGALFQRIFGSGSPSSSQPPTN